MCRIGEAATRRGIGCAKAPAPCQFHISARNPATPLGTLHVETDMVLEEGNRLYLRTDDGGHWDLKLSREVRRVLGLRVKLEGVRVGFDCLSVRRIKRI
jgi:hypothetical protein